MNTDNKVEALESKIRARAEAAASDAHDAGGKAGREWAEQYATPDEFVEMDALRARVARGSARANWESVRAVAPQTIEACIEDRGWLDDDDNDRGVRLTDRSMADYANGFLAGALAQWRIVRDRF